MTYGQLFLQVLRTLLMHITITDNFIICHNFVIKINLKMNFASYGHFVSYENYKKKICIIHVHIYNVHRS